MLMNFLTIFAWLAAVGGGVLVAANVILAYRYEGSLKQKMDKVRGVKVRWPTTWPAFAVFLLGTVFLIAKAMS